MRRGAVQLTIGKQLICLQNAILQVQQLTCLPSEAAHTPAEHLSSCEAIPDDAKRHKEVLNHDLL